jgi:hypothetical protein
LFREKITNDDRAFIERMDMFFLATADAAGRPNCSYKGGDPGFVRVVDESTLVFPNYDGNGMYLSMGNTVENAHVGLLFIDFENQKRLRVNGFAESGRSPRTASGHGRGWSQRCSALPWLLPGRADTGAFTWTWRLAVSSDARNDSTRNPLYARMVCATHDD